MRGTYGRLLSQPVGELLLSTTSKQNDVLPAVFLTGGAFSTCASPHSRGLNGTWRPPEGGFLGSFRGRHNAGRVQMSRGTACCKIHQKNPPGGHGLPEIAKSDFKPEIKTYSIPYTHQGVSGGSRKYFCSAPLCAYVNISGAARQFSEIRSNGPLRYHPISTMESMASMAPFFRQNDPASPPAAHKPNALCTRLPLRPVPSARLARPSLLPFIPPLPGPGRPAESLAWRCVAEAPLGLGDKSTRVYRAVCLQP